MVTTATAKTKRPVSGSNAHSPAPNAPIPWVYYLLLHNPRLLQKNLGLLKERGHIQEIPTLWQVVQGISHMWRFTVANVDAIGTSQEAPVRDNPRAHLLKNQFIRFFALMAEGSINPLDRTGLALTPKRKMRLVLVTFHATGEMAQTVIYDLQLLDCYPGALKTLGQRLEKLLKQPDARDEWIKDMAVYEGYHEDLVPVVKRCLKGDFVVHVPTQREGDDYTVTSFVERCLGFPPTPAETLEKLLKN